MSNSFRRNSKEKGKTDISTTPMLLWQKLIAEVAVENFQRSHICGSTHCWIFENESISSKKRQAWADPCKYFMEDLLFESAILKKAASEGKLVYNEDCTIGQGALRWTIDLVLGSPPQGRFFAPQNGIAKDEIKDVWLSVDAKSVMTEHGKARRNRQRDLNSLATIVKHYYPQSVVCGLMMVNMSERFVSPLRDGITYHKNIEKLVRETIDIFNEIPRAGIQGGAGIEGVGIIVVDHTNDPNDETKLVTKPPAPTLNDPANYRKFLQTIKMALEKRFLT